MLVGFGYNSYSLFAKIYVSDIQGYSVRGLPLIMYASRGVGGSTLMHTNAYKGGWVVYIFVRRFIENAKISESFKPYTGHPLLFH